MTRIASFNVENLFARPKAFNTSDWSAGEPILDAYREVNALFQKAAYSAAQKERMRNLLITLGIYTVNDNGAVRRKESQSPKWAWLRKNRGDFDRQSIDEGRDIEIIANGRKEWIGWVELARAPIKETCTRMTAQVIRDVGADIIGIVEAEDRPSLVRFNDELLGGLYRHIMLIDGNDERGIDVAIMIKDNFEIRSIRSNVDADDAVGKIFSRDCPQYEVITPNANVIHVLVNHFKSQSGGTGASVRKRQAAEVRRIVDSLVTQGQHVVVLGDLNEGPDTAGSEAVNLNALFNNNSPLHDCYALPAFDTGNRPGTFDSCGISNRFDYILLSQSLLPYFKRGGVFRKGLWGSRKTRPTSWTTYEEITTAAEQASDHAAIFIDLDI